jgi:hypothetical protein
MGGDGLGQTFDRGLWERIETSDFLADGRKMKGDNERIALA